MYKLHLSINNSNNKCSLFIIKSCFSPKKEKARVRFNPNLESKVDFYDENTERVKINRSGFPTSFQILLKEPEFEKNTINQTLGNINNDHIYENYKKENGGFRDDIVTLKQKQIDQKKHFMKYKNPYAWLCTNMINEKYRDFHNFNINIIQNCTIYMSESIKKIERGETVMLCYQQGCAASKVNLKFLTKFRDEMLNYCIVECIKSL